jgi:hypothetical protein
MNIGLLNGGFGSFSMFLINLSGIKSRRLTMRQVMEFGKTDDNKRISIDGKVVSLFYFRAAYAEKDFPDEVLLYYPFRNPGKQESL